LRFVVLSRRWLKQRLVCQLRSKTGHRSLRDMDRYFPLLHELCPDPSAGETQQHCAQPGICLQRKPDADHERFSGGRGESGEADDQRRLTRVAPMRFMIGWKSFAADRTRGRSLRSCSPPRAGGRAPNSSGAYWWSLAGGALLGSAWLDSEQFRTAPKTCRAFCSRLTVLPTASLITGASAESWGREPLV
jgi:hypothetical protein